MARGGWGGGPWGGMPWGGASLESGDLTTLGVSESVSITEGLTVNLPYEVDTVVPLSAYLLRVDFTSLVDPLFPDNLDAASYTIPGLTVFSANFNPTFTHSIFLTTSEQLAQSYTLTVALTTQGLSGDVMNPLANTANFLGFPLAPSFFATAQSDTKIMVTFVQTMMVDAALTDPSNYTVRHANGTVHTINTVNQVGLEDRHVELLLSTSLSSGNFYSVTIDASVQTSGGQGLYPDADLFRWVKDNTFTVVELDRFSGEVSTGLLGQPAGQVFVSPALETLAANSILEIDEISVCTRAFDVYQIPSIPDPPVLFTWPPPSTVSTSSNLNGPGVLRASAERLGLARMNLSDFQEDTFTAPVDGPADATLVETIDITTGGFLNDSRWETYPAATASIGVFNTADNLSPIGPGPTTNINLQP